MQKKDFLKISYYIVAMILFLNIALLNRYIINKSNQDALSREVLAAKASTVVEKPVSNTSIKELFVPLGAGNESGDEWKNVSGVEVYLDSQNYKSAKKITFEATFEIPTGNGRAYVRLYNATDGTPVFQSELSNEGAAGTVFNMSSSAFTLFSGNKLYRVQMKNTLRYSTLLYSSRIRISY